MPTNQNFVNTLAQVVRDLETVFLFNRSKGDCINYKSMSLNEKRMQFNFSISSYSLTSLHVALIVSSMKEAFGQYEVKHYEQKGISDKKYWFRFEIHLQD